MAEKNFTSIPNVFFDYALRYGLTGEEVLYICMVKRRAYGSKKAFPSQLTLATSMNMSLMSLRRLSQRMTDLKLQTLSYRKNTDGGRGPNVIDITPAFEAVAEFAQWHKKTIDGLPKEIKESDSTENLIKSKMLQRPVKSVKVVEEVEPGPTATVLKFPSAQGA
jgi:hypothetical protein